MPREERREMASRAVVLGMAGGIVASAGVAHADALVHTEEAFEFTADGPMAVVAPLFGADQERVWAPGWEPRFLHPSPAADAAGSVFLVGFGERDAVWVTTQFDLAAGRVQYVYVVPEVLATVITLRITPRGQRTHVAVTYERTALRP